MEAGFRVVKETEEEALVDSQEVEEKAELVEGLVIRGGVGVGGVV